MKVEIMGGWKTWVSAIALAALGVVDIVSGDYEAGAAKVSAAFGLVGLGHKIEKTKAPEIRG